MGRHLSKGYTPRQLADPHTHTQPEGQELLETEMRLHTETAQSSLTVIFNLVISVLINVNLVVLGTVNFQFQGLFPPISLRPILGIVAAYVMGIIWSSCS